MLTTVFFSVHLILGGLAGAATSDLQVHGKSINSDKTGRQTVRKQPHQQTKGEIRRSLDLETSLHVSPTTSRMSLPTIIKLYPPTAKPLHLHANMPMRFGRENDPGDDMAPNSSPNMPQRFGRSWEEILICAKCPGVREAPKLPQRLAKKSLLWSLLRTLANAQLLNTGLYWAEDIDFSSNAEEVKIQEKTFTG